MKKQLVSKIVAMGLSVLLLSSNMISVSATETNEKNDSLHFDQSTQVEIPVYSSIEEWEASGDTSERVRIKNNTNARYVGGYAEYKYVDTKRANDARVGYHPDFNNWKYVSGYFFSVNKKVTFTPSLSFEWGKVTVSVSVEAGGGNGFYINADLSRRSRPWVRADITTKRYDMYLYDEFGQLEGIYRLAYKQSTVSDIQIMIDHLSY